MIFATSTISSIHSAYSRYEIPLTAKFSTALSSMDVSLVNITFDMDEFDSINDRILSIESQISESMMMRLAPEFESMIDSRGDSFVTKIDSILYAVRISEFLRSSMKSDRSRGDVPTRAIYCPGVEVRNPQNLDMSLVRGNSIIKDYLLIL
jgi:hypothetical protein